MKTPTAPKRPADLWLMPATPVVSTSHIPPDDIPRLDADAANADGPNGVMGKLDHGWLLHIGDELDEAQWPRYSEPFMEMLRLIKAWGFSYLRLDSDGDTLPQLPTF